MRVPSVMWSSYALRAASVPGQVAMCLTAHAERCSSSKASNRRACHGQQLNRSRCFREAVVEARIKPFSHRTAAIHRFKIVIQRQETKVAQDLQRIFRVIYFAVRIVKIGRIVGHWASETGRANGRVRHRGKGNLHLGPATTRERGAMKLHAPSQLLWQEKRSRKLLAANHVRYSDGSTRVWCFFCN